MAAIQDLPIYSILYIICAFERSDAPMMPTNAAYEGSSLGFKTKPTSTITFGVINIKFTLLYSQSELKY